MNKTDCVSGQHYLNGESLIQKMQRNLPPGQCKTCKRIVNPKATVQEVSEELTNCEKRVQSFLYLILLVGGLVGVAFFGTYLSSIIPASLHLVAWSVAGISILVPFGVMKGVNVYYVSKAEKRIEEKEKIQVNGKSGFENRINKRFQTECCRLHTQEQTLTALKAPKKGSKQEKS